MKTEVHKIERTIADFVYNWFIEDPGLMDWKKRGELRDKVDRWCLALDEVEEEKDAQR